MLANKNSIYFIIFLIRGAFFDFFFGGRVFAAAN